MTVTSYYRIILCDIFQENAVCLKMKISDLFSWKVSPEPSPKKYTGQGEAIDRELEISVQWMACTVHLGGRNWNILLAPFLHDAA